MILFNRLFLAGYFILITGMSVALWEIGVLRNTGWMEFVLDALVAAGVGIALSANWSSA